MDGPAVETRELTKYFGSVRALEDVDLEVQPGEVFGFLGPNGAGKTTAIRLMLDFLRPTRGSVRVLGGHGGDPAVRARMGYLPADVHVDSRYRADELFAFLGALRGVPSPPLLPSLLERFGLDATRPIGELSTGNKRKVGIVQAFMHRPELLVLDEPTSGLDPILQVEFLDLVREQVAGGATVFLSSHYLPEVERVADRVGILRQGRLVALSRVAELRARARQRIDLFVSGPADLAGFAGTPGVVEASAPWGPDGGLVRLVVEGPVDAALKAAAGSLTVERVVTHEADLEEVFLDYYREDHQ